MVFGFLSSRVAFASKIVLFYIFKSQLIFAQCPIDQTLMVDLSSFECSGTSTIILNGSEIGAKYYLRNNNTASYFDTISGTSGAISFSSVNVFETTLFTVMAERNNCTTLLSTTVTITIDYKTVINEVVTDPQQDWSAENFAQGSSPGGIPGAGDEWIEVFIGCPEIDLTGWTIELLDGSDVIGSLESNGAFEVSNYVSNSGGVFVSSKPGDYLVLGNVVGSGQMNNNIKIELKDSNGYVVDQVQIGGGEAPNGNSTDIIDEAVVRMANAVDTDTDDQDFIKTISSIGKTNSPTGEVLINEIVTDPVTDWSSNNFTGIAGGGVVSERDEWIELYIGTSGLNLTAWMIELNDITPVTGDLTNGVDGAFQTVRYFSNTSGSGWHNTAEGDFVVLGNVNGGFINNTGTFLIKDPASNIVDQVTLGGGNAPNGGSTGNADEAIARKTGPIDTGNDKNDFFQNMATLGFDNGISIALPLYLLSFYVNIEKGGVKIFWNVADEENKNSYLIKHSMDGEVYQNVAEIKPKGLKRYDFFHQIKEQGIHFYKISQIQENGKWWDSEILSVSVFKEQKIKVMPNPFADWLSLCIEGLKPQNFKASLLNIYGRVMKESLGFEFSTVDISKGAYILKVELDDVVSEFKVVKVQ